VRAIYPDLAPEFPVRALIRWRYRFGPGVRDGA
jgi:hypothetical protein